MDNLLESMVRQVRLKFYRVSVKGTVTKTHWGRRILRHVIMRGNNKSYFFDKADSKAYFMKVLLTIEKEEDMDVVAWCLMDNHVHLVLRIPIELFDHVFKRLNVKYAAYYHRQNKTVGHVFQGRAKSLPLESDASLANNVRYVHNNPVNAGMVVECNDYEWSSYNPYMFETRNKSMKMVKDIIGRTNDAFKDFHQIEDQEIYLEIQEDQNVRREKKAQEIIQQKCKQYGVIDISEIYNHKEVLNDIIATLIEESGMSGRKIAKLVGISERSIRRYKKG